jgi:hypothetical protein
MRMFADRSTDQPWLELRSWRPSSLPRHRIAAVSEMTGAEHDRIYAEQARRYPGFAEYARQTAGVRTIPVLELRRA